MTKSKILFGFMIIAIATLFIYSCTTDNGKDSTITQTVLESRNNGDLLDLLGTACVPSTIVVPGACNDTIYTDTAVITNHSMYPGCTFKVIYKRQECLFGGFSEDVTIGDFQIFEHNCSQFSTDINNNYNQTVWSSFIINFETATWNSIRDNLISQKVTGNKYRCGLGVFFNINFIRASCVRYASVIQKNGLGICTKITCGNQCCERHTRVCRNADGSLNITQTDVTDPQTIDCSDPPFLTDPPVWLGEVQWLTSCMVSCPN